MHSASASYVFPLKLHHLAFCASFLGLSVSILIRTSARYLPFDLGGDKFAVVLPALLDRKREGRSRNEEKGNGKKKKKEKKSGMIEIHKG